MHSVMQSNYLGVKHIMIFVVVVIIIIVVVVVTVTVIVIVIIIIVVTTTITTTTTIIIITIIRRTCLLRFASLLPVFVVAMARPQTPDGAADRSITALPPAGYLSSSLTMAPLDLAALTGRHPE